MKVSSHMMILFVSMFLIGSQVAPFSFQWMDYQTLSNLIVEETDCEEKESEVELEEEAKFSQFASIHIELDFLHQVESLQVLSYLPAAPYLERPCPPPDFV
jgi:hypothetical protein